MPGASVDFWLQFGVTLAAAGFVAGFLGGLLGGGGGLIVVPALYHAFGALGVDAAVRMQLVVGTALASVVPLSIVGARAHWRLGHVDAALLKPLVPMALAGSLAAGFIGHRLQGGLLAMLFAGLALLVSLNLLFRPRAQAVSLRRPAIGLIGAGIGCLSSLVGIGGATLTVPVLQQLGAPMRTAIGTASTLGMAIALPGAVSFALAGAHAEHLPPGSIGYVNLFAAAVLFLSGGRGIAIGSRLTRRLDEQLLRRLFALLLLASALRMVLATSKL